MSEQRQPLIFPLHRLSTVDVAALQFALRPTKLLQPAFMQQRLVAFQGLLAPRIPTSRPWNSNGLPSLIDAPTLIPSVVHELLPKPPTSFQISGLTKDETGTATDGYNVYLFDMTSGLPVLEQTMVSANGGQYSFFVGQRQYWAVDYKIGSPSKAGVTLPNLIGQ